jgi:hypothetical protein
MLYIYQILNNLVLNIKVHNLDLIEFDKIFG